MGCADLARFAAKPEAQAQPPIVEEIRPAPLPGAAAEPPKEPDKPLKTPLYEWKGTGQPITRIVINTDDQRARFYSGETEIGWTTVATGVPKYPTPIGRFQITEKIENKRSNLYGKIYGQKGQVLRANAKVGRDPIPEGARFEGVHMPFYLRLTGDGIGLHAGPIPSPGRPASHGCIRLPAKIAPVVFKHVSTGTPVTIEGKGPSYSEYLAQQRAQAARLAANTSAKIPSAAHTLPAAQNPSTAEPKPAESAPAPVPQPPVSLGPEVAATNQPTAPAPVNPETQQTAPAPGAPQPVPATSPETQQAPQAASGVPAPATSSAAPVQPVQAEIPQPAPKPAETVAPASQQPAAGPDQQLPAPTPQGTAPAQPPAPAAQPQSAAPA